MQQDLESRLLATPTLELPTIGLGSMSSLTDGQRADLRTMYSIAQRREWTASGFTLPNGSFPIPNVSYLRRCVAALECAHDRGAARRWIVRRARDLSRTDVLPVKWGVMPTRRAMTASTADDVAFGVMIAAYPPIEMADVLAGGYEGDHAADDMHVTLAYLGTIDELNPDALALLKDRLSNVASVAQTLSAHVSGVSSFNSEEGDNPQIYTVECSGLTDLRQAIMEACFDVDIFPSQEHEFTPHITVRYGGPQLASVPPGGDSEWNIDRIVLSVGPESVIFPFGSDATFAGGTAATPKLIADKAKADAVHEDHNVDAAAHKAKVVHKLLAGHHKKLAVAKLKAKAAQR